MPSLYRLRNLAGRFPDASGVLALLLLCLLVFWPLLTGQAFFFGDLELYFYPLTEFWRRELAKGHLPLWNPLQFGGVPFAGNPQISLLYPPSWLLLFFPTIIALSLSAILHLWGSGAVFFLWMRRGQLRLGAGAALLGAMCWMLGGAFVSKTQFPNMLAALAYLPAALWATEVLLKRPGVRSAATLGTVLGLQLLAAHAQVSLYTLYLLLFYVLWNWKALRGAPTKIILGLFFALALGALLDGGQLLPVAENLRGAQRQVLSLETAPRFTLPLWAVTNLFAPYLYGNPNHGTWTYHGGGNAWETACYLGILPFLLAIWGLGKGRFWTLAALVCLVLAMGPAGGLYLAAFQFLPGVARFHDAARFLMPAGLAFSVMAALGWQKMSGISKVSRLAPLLLFLCALDLGLFARSFYPLRATAQLAPPPSFSAANDPLLNQNQVRIWSTDPKAARSVLLDYGNYALRTPSQDAGFPFGIIPNTHIWNGLMEAGGYDPISPGLVAARLKALQLAPDAREFPAGYASLLGAHSIRFVSVWRRTPLPPAPSLREIYRSAPTRNGSRLWVYRNDLCLPRANFLTLQGGLASADIISPDANTLQIEIPPATLASAQLNILDNYSPSWRGFENGTPIQIRPTTRGYSRLELAPIAGKREIRLVYAPQSFRFGVFLSLCALCAVVTLFCATKKPETK